MVVWIVWMMFNSSLNCSIRIQIWMWRSKINVNININTDKILWVGYMPLALSEDFIYKCICETWFLVWVNCLNLSKIFQLFVLVNTTCNGILYRYIFTFKFFKLFLSSVLDKCSTFILIDSIIDGDVNYVQVNIK